MEWYVKSPFMAAYSFPQITMPLCMCRQWVLLCLLVLMWSVLLCPRMDSWCQQIFCENNTVSWKIETVLNFFPFFFFWSFFRATPAAYRGSQARGQIGAVATGLRHSHRSAESELCLWLWDLHHNSLKCQVLNPLSKARDRTSVFMDASQICFC